MAIFECVGGISPTGNARPSDVKVGVTFSNENDIDQVGTFAPQQKTITSSRRDQTVIPDEGCYLNSVIVEGLEPTGTYRPTSRSASIDMGDESNYRYVNTEGVPNNNSGTYTYGAGSTGGTVDLGVTNTYRYVNAGNVYNKGYSDGSNAGYSNGYSQGYYNGSPGSVTFQTHYQGATSHGNTVSGYLSIPANIANLYTYYTILFSSDYGANISVSGGGSNGLNTKYALNSTHKSSGIVVTATSTGKSSVDDGTGGYLSVVLSKT